MPLTLRSVKGSQLTTAEMDENLTYLESMNAALPTVTITADTSLTATDHANRDLINEGASNFVLTLQTDANSGCSGSEAFNGVQQSTGKLSIVAAVGVTLLTPNGTTATTTEAGTFVGALRIGVDTYTLTEKAVATSGYSLAGTHSSYFVPARPGTAATIDQGGMCSYNLSGTATTRGSASGSILGETPRVSLVVGAAAANAVAGLDANANIPYFSSLPFLMETVFSHGDAIASGAKGMIGVGEPPVSGLGAAEEPNSPTGATAARALLAYRSTDSQFIFVTNDNSGSAVVTTLNGGVGLPCNTNNTNLYKFRLEYIPTGPRRIEMTLTNLSTGVTSNKQTFTSKIPSATDLLMIIAKRCSGANVAAPIIDFSSLATGKFA